MADAVNLTGTQETLFIPLLAKAVDYRSKHSILHDKKADDILQSINYNFEKHKKLGHEVLVVRAKQIDHWVTDFIKLNANAVIVYLGCGLDSRYTRINPPAEISWFDVDFPDVIQLRKTFYADKDGYRMIESSITELGWLTTIPTARPALIVADGVLEYLTKEEVKTLFKRLTDYFSHGEMVFDVMSSWAVNSGEKELKDTTGAVLKWAVDNAAEVDSLNAKLKRVGDISLFKSPYISRLPLKLRFTLRASTLIPRFKNMIRLMRYRF